MEAKENIVGDGEAKTRYILVRNPEEAKRDQAKREETIKRLKEELASNGEHNGAPHTKAVCQLIAHPTYGRYLYMDKNGSRKLTKQRSNRKLDGKYLLSTSDDTLSPEDVALGYKQLLQVEDAFRTLKTTLDLRPIYHRLEDSIRSHVLLCWLALLLSHCAENKTQNTWRNMRDKLQRMHLVKFNGECRAGTAKDGFNHSFKLPSSTAI